MGTAREPPHDPAAPLRPAQLRVNSRRVLVTTRPDRGVNGLHRTRAHRIASAGLMGSEQDFGAGERGGPCVLDDVVVVTGQDADPATMRSIEDGVTVAIR